MGTGEFNAGGNPAMDLHPIQGGVEILLVASCYGNRDKIRLGGPLGSCVDFTFVLVCMFQGSKLTYNYCLSRQLLNFGTFITGTGCPMGGHLLRV